MQGQRSYMRSATLRCSISVILSLFAAGNGRAGGFDGDSVSLAGYCCTGTGPIEANRITNILTTTVGPGIEFTADQVKNIGSIPGFTIIGSDYNIGTSTVDIGNFTSTAVFTPAPFNAAVLSFGTLATRPPISNVTINPLSTYTTPKITFDANDIFLNVGGTLVTPTSRLLLDVSFASPPPQTLYLNFGQTLAPVPSVASTWWTNHVGNTVALYTKPDAGLTPEQINAVVKSVGDLFAPFNITVTADATQLPSGPYSTVYIGGNRSELGQPFQNHLELPDPKTGKATKNYLGVAQMIDFGDADKSDVAHVFSGLPDLGTLGTTTYLQNLALVIDHEVGHILGLQHVQQTGDLMYPDFAGLEPVLTNGDLNIAALDGGCQNDYQQIGRNVGLLTGSPSPISACEQLGQNNPGTWLARLLGGVGLYGAQLAVQYDGDIGPTIYDLGDLAPEGTGVSRLHIPSAQGATFALFGSSSPGGPIDIISSPFGPDVLDQFASLDALTQSDILTSFDGSGSRLSNLFEFAAGQGFTEIGSLSLSLEATVPEPSTIWLVGMTVVMLLAMNGRTGLLLRRARFVEDERAVRM